MNIPISEYTKNLVEIEMFGLIWRRFEYCGMS